MEFQDGQRGSSSTKLEIKTYRKSGSSGGQTSTWDQRSSIWRQCSLSPGLQCGLRTTQTQRAPDKRKEKRAGQDGQVISTSSREKREKSNGQTELIPKLSALVGHWCALRLPLEESRVGQKLIGDEREHSRAVRVPGSQHFPHLGEHGHQLLVDVVVAALGEERSHLFADLLFVQVPTVLVVSTGSSRRIRST